MEAGRAQSVGNVSRLVRSDVNSTAGLECLVIVQPDFSDILCAKLKNYVH